MPKTLLSVQTLGKITLLQSRVTVLSDQATMIDVTVHGIQELPGIQSVAYAEKLAKEELQHIQTDQKAILPIQYKKSRFGGFIIKVSDIKHFSLYVQFLQNFITMLGVLFEEKHQCNLNEVLKRDLEHRVAKRTKELRESEEKYRHLIEGLGPRYCVFSHTIEGVFLYVSGHFNQLFGLSTKEVVGTNWRMLPLTAESIERGKEADRRILTEKTYQRVELEVVYNNKPNRFVEVYYGPVLDNGVIVKMEGICSDISEQKNSEQIIRRSQKLESLGTLAGGIAHDFNNLLGGIYGYIDIAAEMASEEVVQKNLEKSIATIDKARALTNHLLTFSKGGQPKKRLESLVPFIMNTAQFVLSGSNSSCEFRISEQLWPCEIDKGQIGQVIENIVINAKQAMPNGGTIMVTAENVPTAEGGGADSGGDSVRVTVTDYGIGIPAEVQPRIFDPFFATKKKGHGLGLTMCHSIINRHGGTIGVESAPGEGCTVTFSIPAKRTTVDSLIESSIRRTGAGMILIMDDEQYLLNIMSAMLKGLGYHVVSTINGDEVITFLQSAVDGRENLRGMIFDLTIPGARGGKDIVDEVRVLDPTIPIFVASGYADSPVMANPTKYGFTASIPKPFTKSELEKVLVTYL